MALKGHLLGLGKQIFCVSEVQERSQKGREKDAEEAGELKIDGAFLLVPQELLRAVSSTGTRWVLKPDLQSLRRTSR